MEDNVFIKIINKEIPADIVYEDEDTLAFLDATPNRKGHTLVIPKKHYKDIFEFEEAEAEKTMRTILKVARGIKKGTGAKGVKIINNNGFDAGQRVFHIHFHIIPFFGGDDWDRLPHVEYESDEEKNDFKKRIMDSI